MYVYTHDVAIPKQLSVRKVLLWLIWLMALSDMAPFSTMSLQRE